MSITQKVKTTFLKISGYLIPLAQQIPSLGVGGMTLPVLIYLVALFTNFNFIGLLNDIRVMIIRPLYWALVVTGVSISGLVLTLYSVVYLRQHKNQRLVTAGPYRYSRHPQYTGFLLMILGLTSWSCWVLTHFRGRGWLTPCETVLLWYATLSAYIILALVEESYLSKEFGTKYATYKNKTPFFLPIGKAWRYNHLLSILALTLILFVLLSPSLSRMLPLC